MQSDILVKSALISKSKHTFCLALFQVIPIEYLKELHALHEEWLMTPDSKAPAKTLVVDFDQDIHSCPQLYEKIVSKVMAIIGGEPETKKARLSVPERVMMSPIKSLSSPVKAVVVPAAF